MNPVAEDILMHIGIPRRSGRYPWGSGEDAYQHGSRDFLGRVEELRKQGFTYVDENGKKWTGDTAIAKSMGMSTTNFRTELGLATDERKLLKYARAQSLYEDGLTYTQIGREMGVNESTVRSMLANKNATLKMEQAKNTADFIREKIESDGMILDIGKGVAGELNISQEKLNQALYILEREGYPIYSNRIEQVTNRGNWTTQKVICPKGTEYKDAYKLENIKALNEDNFISRDGGVTFEKKFNYPESLDSKRLMIRYSEDGGLEKDGIVELRRGVKDLSLGESRYSQVRILVDGTHYIKGMAVYADDKDMPAGVDVVFNTNKKQGTPMKDVLKKIKSDPDNPFGSAIKDADQGGQYWYEDGNGNKKLGLINKRADEGDWSDWKDALPSQFLSKQSLSLAKKQLGLAKSDKELEFKDICELDNPTVKKHLLSKFADECDAAAVDLKAAALPGQKYHVIIPINSLKDTEIYAPNYRDGDQLALVRYPHAGTFEIPILTVNNKHAPAKKLLGTDVGDAVGINSKVAAQLSGADFDGDTVMCIPTNTGRVNIKNKQPIKELQNFDPKAEYGTVFKDGDYYRNGRKVRLMKDEAREVDNTQIEMGKISNLITDMTLQNAPQSELVRAVKHSMVVIDAGKHKLDYKASEIDNNIAALKKEYQRYVDADGNVRSGGAGTLISRSKGQVSVDKRQGTPKINIKGTKDYDPSKPEGALIYKPADDLYYTYTTTNKRTGEVKTVTKARKEKSTRMRETDDAYTLLSEAKHPMEIVYADYANSMKDLANRARIELTKTGKVAYNANSKKVYQTEVDSLKQKLHDAELNITRERAAQRKANAEIQSKLASGQLVKKQKGDVKKASQQALTKYRDEVGSISRSKRSIKITDREWDAIQSGAISESILKRILSNTDVDSLRERATPRTKVNLSTAKVNQIKNLKNNGYTLSEIAAKLNVSTSTVSKYLKGGN